MSVRVPTQRIGCKNKTNIIWWNIKKLVFL